MRKGHGKHKEGRLVYLSMLVIRFRYLMLKGKVAYASR